MSYTLSARSRKSLEGVHPDLVEVVNRAIEITSQDFAVIQGLRTKAQQAENVRKGVSWTTKSRHLTGHAIDVVPYPIDWNDLDKFTAIRDAFMQASKELDIPIRWGGDWNNSGDYRDEIKRGTYDGGHFELPRRYYPASPAKAVATSKRVGFASIGTVATLGVATDTLNQFAGFKAALGSVLDNVPEWIWLILVLAAFAGIIWTKWHDIKGGNDRHD